MKTIILDFDGTIFDLKNDVPLVSRTVLSDLKNQFNLALVTGSPRHEVLEVFARLGWQDLFAVIITKDDTEFFKDTGIPFQLVTNKLNGPAIVVGDSLSDMAGANRAGLPCVRVLPGGILAALDEARQTLGIST